MRLRVAKKHIILLKANTGAVFMVARKVAKGAPATSRVSLDTRRLRTSELDGWEYLCREGG